MHAHILTEAVNKPNTATLANATEW